MSELNKRGQSVFNTSEIERRKKKNLIKNDKNAIKYLKLISIKGLSENQLNKDVITYVSKLLKNPDSTSSASSSHIRDPNNFNNFNKKKIIEIIRNKVLNNNLSYDRMFQDDSMVSEIENMNELILPTNARDFTNVHKLIAQYYRISITHDILALRSFDQSLNSSRFKILKSDKNFFISTFEQNLDNPKIHRTYETLFIGSSGLRFYNTLYIDVVNHDEFIISLLLIIRHIHFKEIVKEILYSHNNFKQYNVNHVNNMRNHLATNISNERRKTVGQNGIKMQQFLNTVEKTYNKTFDKIIKELEFK
jgi:hypothetical protein